MRSKTTKNGIFNFISVKAPGRNNFDLSRVRTQTGLMGRLMPAFIQETVPGDTFTIGANIACRLQPMVAPVMQRLDMRMEYFYVANRIVWPNFTDFITGKDPLLVSPYILLTRGLWDTYKLFDYMGVPRPGASQTIRINAIPFAAYQMVYNTYYRRQYIVDEVEFELSDGNNTSNTQLFTLRSRAWNADIFTSALPFAQAGQPVSIPFSAEVTLKPDDGSHKSQYILDANDRLPVTDEGLGARAGGRLASTDGTPGGRPVTIDPAGTWETENGTSNINDLRTAWSIQRFLELLARAGTQYTEYLRAFFGVKSSDARLQRPEYIVGVKDAIVISEVLNTTGTTDLPQANMAGHGLGYTQGTFKRYNCEEEGFILGLCSVLPTTMYEQGIPNHFFREDKFDYFNPMFDHLGEQEVKNKEVYIEHPDPDGVFGYTPRYSPFKSSYDEVAGQIKTTLDVWTFSRKFDTPPALNADFVIADDVTLRPFAVQDEEYDPLIIQVNNQISALRPMSRYSTPM